MTQASKVLILAAVLSGCTDAAKPSHDYMAVIRGTLASSDLGQAQAMHDQIAMGGHATAAAADDFAHDVLLGTTILDSTQNEFLAIDQWSDQTAMESFYTDPTAFGGLFTGNPTIEFFQVQDDWVHWGDMSSGDPFTPHYIHFALGQLSQTDVAANHDAHDMVASGGKEPSIMAGNVGHIVLLGTHDQRRFLGIDIWKVSDPIMAFYTDPHFVAVFAPLFASIEQPVFQSTSWYQW